MQLREQEVGVLVLALGLAALIQHLDVIGDGSFVISLDLLRQTSQQNSCRVTRLRASKTGVNRSACLNRASL